MKDETTRLEEGQGAFCDIIKGALYQEDESIFDRLDFYNDTIFLEPMLFGYCTSKTVPYNREQILFGYYDKENRPSNIEVYTNKRGIVYLPQYGYLKTVFPSTLLQLNYDAKAEVIYLEQNGQHVEFEWEALHYLDVLPNVEISTSLDAYSEGLIAAWPNVSPTAIHKVLQEDNISIKTHQSALEEAFRILKTYFPEEFKFYAATTRRILLFSSPELRNFATREAHGVIYLNVNAQSTVAFFLEELIHQCSHTVFNAMTCDTQALFLVDYNRPVGDFVPNYDRRTLYSALHGIYTTGRIVDLLLQLLKQKPPFDVELLYELEGRIAINKKRHNIGLERVPLDEVFTPKGKALFNYYYQQLDHNIKANTSFFDYNMQTHPVVFNYQKFKADNPLVKG